MQFDDDFEYLTKEEAVSQAKEIAIRNLEVGTSRISCVGYFEGFSDYVLVNYHKEPKGWIEVFTILPNDMRLETELIKDSTIKSLANEGNLISAIRLYRAKYNVGLAEAKNGVNQLK